MNGKLSKLFKRKVPTKETLMSAAAAGVESVAMDMRTLAKEVNAKHNELSCVRVVINDMVCPSRTPVMVWLCYSHLPHPGTDLTPSYQQIHTTNDLYKKEKMFGFRPEDLDLIKSYFEATQKLNARAEEASRHYIELYFS